MPEYSIVACARNSIAEAAIRLTEFVRAKIAEGWEPIGGAQFAQMTDAYGQNGAYWASQTMIRHRVESEVEDA